MAPVKRHEWKKHADGVERKREREITRGDKGTKKRGPK